MRVTARIPQAGEKVARGFGEKNIDGNFEFYFKDEDEFGRFLSAIKRYAEIEVLSKELLN